MKLNNNEKISVTLTGDQWHALKGLIEYDEDSNHRYNLSSYCSDKTLEVFDTALDEFKLALKSIKSNFPNYSKYKGLKSN